MKYKEAEAAAQKLGATCVAFNNLYQFAVFFKDPTRQELARYDFQSESFYVCEDRLVWPVECLRVFGQLRPLRKTALKPEHSAPYIVTTNPRGDNGWLDSVFNKIFNQQGETQVNDIKVGDRVKVTLPGQQHPTYYDWAKRHGLPNYKRFNASVEEGFEGTVIAVGPHLGEGVREKNTVLCGITNGSVDVILNVLGVTKISKGETQVSTDRKPIQEGMTEAVTRDGRPVTELTWFKGAVKGNDCVAGIVDGRIATWSARGSYSPSSNKHPTDIFAPVEYEYQWLLVSSKGVYKASEFYPDEETLHRYLNHHFWSVVHRIEESKREVKS